jgi:glycosyltransferase involved in cell wall biosynthesis
VEKSIAMSAPPSSVAILLSVHNGERFLLQQLDSLVAQTCRSWTLFWRDDGSSDDSTPILHRFSTAQGSGRTCFAGSGWLGVARSYLSLLATASTSSAAFFAFADQDDVWCADKLARGLAAFEGVPADTPAIYCARQVLVDAELHKLGESPVLRRAGGFPAALTQNIATGCTVIVNRAAAALVLSTTPPEGTLHDWWCYLVVAAAGGRVLTDARTVVLYRQHAGNVIGAPAGILRRALAALLRGRTPFMRLFRRHVAALQAHQELLSDTARAELAIVAAALAGGMADRFRALGLRGFRRQTWLEDLVFRVWFLCG